MDVGPRMRLPNTAHTSRPWRIHELTRDFRLEDVWALPTPGGPDDFPQLVRLMASGERSQGGSSRAARTLWAIRWKVGELLGWDGPDAGLGSRVPTLRDRLPVDLRNAPSGPDFDALPFTSLYLLEDEFAAEIVNRTVLPRSRTRASNARLAKLLPAGRPLIRSPASVGLPEGGLGRCVCLSWDCCSWWRGCARSAAGNVTDMGRGASCRRGAH